MSKHIFTLNIQQATSTQSGIVKISDSLTDSSDSSLGIAASPKSIKDTNDKIDVVNNNLNVLENTVSSNTTDISELSSSTQASIDSINTNISTINTDILDIENKVNTNSSSIESLVNKDKDIDTSITNLQEQITKLDEESDTHLVNTGGTINGNLIVTGDVTVEGTINANIEGTSSSAITATKDSDGNIIVDTYATIEDLNTANNSVNTLSTKLTNNYYDKSSIDTFNSNLTTNLEDNYYNKEEVDTLHSTIDTNISNNTTKINNLESNIATTYATKEELKSIDVSGSLHKVASSGSYNDLIDTPSIYTQEEINTLLDTKVTSTDILDNGIIKSSVLPSYVDDVEEYSSYDNLPTTGEGSKIYVTTDTNKTFRWSGTSYVEISSSLTLGTTSGTAYEGSSGKLLEESLNTFKEEVSTTYTSNTTFNSTIENINNSISNIENTYSTKEELNNLNSTLTNSITTLSDTLTNNYYTKEELDTTIGNINTSINNVSDNLNNNYYTKDDINTSFDTTNTNISNLENNLNTNYYTSSTIDTKLDTVNTNIEETTNKVDSIIEENTKNSSLVTLSDSTIDLSLGKVFYIEILNDTTFTITNVEDDYTEFTLFTKNANSFNISFGDSIVTSNAFDLVYSYGVDVFKFTTIDKGLTWYIKQDGQYLG